MIGNPQRSCMYPMIWSFCCLLLPLFLATLQVSHAQGSDNSNFKQGLERVATSLPKEWTFAVTSAMVNREPKQGQPNVDVAIAYDRHDIERIYGAVKLVNQMIRDGRTSESDFARVPAEYKSMPASLGSGFISSVGKVMGYSAAETRAQATASWRYRIAVQDRARKQIGSLVVSHGDIMDLVNGRISPTDLSRVARIYNFD